MGANESKREKRRFFAIASVGRSRWYWAVWPSLEEIHASEEPIFLVGEGYEKTKAAAVEKALELAGRYAELIAAKYALTYHHRKTATTRNKTRTNIDEVSASPAAREFMYRDVYDARIGQWEPLPYRVVTRTSKYVYVAQQPYSPDDLTGSWLDRELLTFRLDRQSLEQDGYAFIPATAPIADTEQPIFFSDARMKLPERHSFRCLQVLNLNWPCTEAEVKGAYRRLVKQAHPDGGGSQDQFLKLQEAFEQAMQLCRQREGL